MRLDVFLPPDHLQQVTAEAQRLGQGVATTIRAMVINRLRLAQGGGEPLPPPPPVDAPMVRKPVLFPQNIAAAMEKAAVAAGYRLQTDLVRAIVEEWCGPPKNLVQWISRGRLAADDAACLQGLLGGSEATGILLAGPAASGKTTLLCALLATIPPQRRVLVTALHPLPQPYQDLLQQPAWCTLVCHGLPLEVQVVEAAVAAGPQVVAIDALAELEGGLLRLAHAARQAGASVIATLQAAEATQPFGALQLAPVDLFPRVVWVEAGWREGAGQVQLLSLMESPGT